MIFLGLCFPICEIRDWIRQFLRSLSAWTAYNSRICWKELLEALNSSRCGGEEKALCYFVFGRPEELPKSTKDSEDQSVGSWRQLLHTLKFHWSSAFFLWDTWSYIEIFVLMTKNRDYIQLVLTELPYRLFLEGILPDCLGLFCMDCWILILAIHHPPTSKEV